MAADKAVTDLLIISQEVSDPSNLDSLVRLAMQQLAKREATVVVRASSEAVASRLAGKAFQIVPGIDGDKPFALYSHKGAQAEVTLSNSEVEAIVGISTC